MSLTREVALVVPTTHLLVLKKLYLYKQISSFGLNFERCNFADVVYPQTATLHKSEIIINHSFNEAICKKINIDMFVLGNINSN